MRVDFHMKSGKTISQRHVKDYKFKWSGNEIVAVELKLMWYAGRYTIIMGTLALDQIECVTIH